MGGWMGGWMGGRESRVKDCLQQSKIILVCGRNVVLKIVFYRLIFLDNARYSSIFQSFMKIWLQLRPTDIEEDFLEKGKALHLGDQVKNKVMDMDMDMGMVNDQQDQLSKQLQPRQLQQQQQLLLLLLLQQQQPPPPPPPPPLLPLLLYNFLSASVIFLVVTNKYVHDSTGYYLAIKRCNCFLKQMNSTFKIINVKVLTINYCSTQFLFNCDVLKTKYHLTDKLILK
jgi:hypothetical protein